MKFQLIVKALWLKGYDNSLNKVDVIWKK